MQQTAVQSEDLVRLWSGALVFLPHMDGCGCMGSMHITLDRNSVEEDILDYLLEKYRQTGCAVLADFVSQRLATRLLSDGKSFVVWLRELDRAALDANDRAQLIEDLRATLQSMNAPTAGSGFQCI